MITILLCVLGALSAIYYLLTRNYKYWESKGVPFDKPFLFFGSFYSVATGKEHLSSTVRSIYERYETPYVGFYAFNKPFLMVRDLDLVKKVLVKDFDKFMNRDLASNEKVDPIAYHTLFSAKGAPWQATRSKISPVFTSGKIKMMLPLIKECAENLNGYLEERVGRTVEFRYLAKKYAMDVIFSCAFGINGNCLKDGDSELVAMANRLLDPKSFKRNFSLFSFFFAPKLVDIFRLTFADKVASDYLFNIFKSTVNEREKLDIERHDLIDLLNNLKKNETITDDYKFDDNKMAAQAISFFSAGNDTTSLILSFTLYELAYDLAVQDRLRSEVKQTFERDGAFTYEGIQGMKYLNMVICESLRKYPLTTFLGRAARTDYVFEETGVKIEKNTNIMIPVSGLHFDPDYFPDPDRFDPDRFSDENKSNIKPFAYLPFGDGPRNCIGQRFAMVVIKVALFHLIKDFSFKLDAATSVPLKIYPKSLFLQNEGGIHLKVAKV